MLPMLEGWMDSWLQAVTLKWGERVLPLPLHLTLFPYINDIFF
jgi:hypothetical protein